MPICPVCGEIYLDTFQHQKDRGHSPVPTPTKPVTPPERGPVRREPRIAEMRREEEEERTRRLLERGIDVPGRRLTQGKLIPEVEKVPEGGPRRRPEELPSRIDEARKNRLVNETGNLIFRFNSLAQDFKVWPREQFFPGAIQNAQNKLTEASRLLDRNRSILSEPIPRLEALDEVEKNNKSVVGFLDEVGSIYQKNRLKVGEQVKKRYEPEKEAETKERLAKLPGGGLLSPSTPIEEARRRPAPPTEVPTGRPPAPPEGRDEGGDIPVGEPGEITGKVVNSDNNKGIEGAQVGAYAAPQGFYDITQTDDKGVYILNAPSGRRYRLQATASGYRTTSIMSPRVEAGKPVTADSIKMKPEKKELRGMKRLKKDVPVFNGDWWFGRGDYEGQNGSIRLGLALALTGLLFFLFYRPFFDAIGLSNFIFDWVIPWMITPFLMFFVVSSKFTNDPNWGPIIFAGVVATGLLILVATVAPPFLKEKFFSTSYFWAGSWLAIFLFVANASPKEKQGMVKTLITYGGILLILGTLFLIWNLIASGDAFKIETYIKTLDVLKLVGVPQETVDGIKDGIRNTLSFLQFKGAEPLKPEAKKIGGFEAIQLKFGSRYNEFLLPTLFARMDYTLPITVANPNKLDTKLLVEDFDISDAFLMSSDGKVICGGDVVKDEQNNLVSTIPVKMDKINPEEEKLTTIEFKGKTTQENGNPLTNVVGATVDCRNVLKKDEPLSPATFKQFAKEVLKECGDDRDIFIDVGGAEITRQQCRNNVCEQECSLTVDNFNAKYGLPSQTADPSGDQIYPQTSKYIESEGVCECKAKRYYNVMDEMCFFKNDNAKVTLTSSYKFKVQGKGELIVVKTDADRKLAPKPVITSSAGPLTVTAYFVSDIDVIESKTKARNMFIDIKNDGEGTAKITGLKINSVNIPSQQSIPLLSPYKNIIKCSPDPTRVPIGKESITVICSLVEDQAQASSVLTGSYRTAPVIIDVDYTYSQFHSTSVKVKKEVIPDEVVDQGQVRELNKNFYTLPYYCPVRKVSDPDPNFAIENPLVLFAS